MAGDSAGDMSSTIKETMVIRGTKMGTHPPSSGGQRWGHICPHQRDKAGNMSNIIQGTKMRTRLL